MKLQALEKLFRLRPVIAWTICGVLLGVSVAINEYGFDLNYFLVAQVLFGALLIQGIIAHAVNDLVDESVDRKTDIKGTGRFKVLISGIATRKELALLSIFCILLTIHIASNMYASIGDISLLFYFIGLYAAICYSLPPFKLGWRPFAEWTIVFPVLTTLVVATNYIATGHFSYLSVLVGFIFALLNIIWFIVSRIMDYIPDKEAGKITTPVRYGIKPMFNYICYILALLMGLITAGVMANLAFGLVILPIVSIVMLLSQNWNTNYISSSIMRTKLINICNINALILSIALIAQRLF